MRLAGRGTLSHRGPSHDITQMCIELFYGVGRSTRLNSAARSSLKAAAISDSVIYSYMQDHPTLVASGACSGRLGPHYAQTRTCAAMPTIC
jgi:hypothetical protein